MASRVLSSALLLCTVACVSFLVAEAQTPTARDVTVTDVLKSTGAYLEKFAETLGTLIAEEEYTQREPAAGNASRRLLADMVFVGFDGGQIGAFRDVVAIDGRDVRQRDGRLAQLFTSGATEAAQDQAKAFAEEGLRYYLSPNLRTLDIPTLALEFLRPVNQPHSEFALDGGIRNQDGARVATVKFKADKNADVLPVPEDANVTGKAWIDVATGGIRQTELVVTGKNFNFKTTTKYAHDKGLDLWLPSEVSQLVDVTLSAAGLSNMGAGGQMGSRQSLEARARYAKYRRLPRSQ
jgi:hypothetical protein